MTSINELLEDMGIAGIVLSGADSRDPLDALQDTPVPTGSIPLSREERRRLREIRRAMKAAQQPQPTEPSGLVSGQSHEVRSSLAGH